MYINNNNERDHITSVCVTIFKELQTATYHLWFYILASSFIFKKIFQEIQVNKVVHVNVRNFVVDQLASASLEHLRV